MCKLVIKAAILTTLLSLTFGCSTMKQVGKDIGHTTKKVTTDIGHASRDAAKSTSEAVKDN